MPGAHGLRLHCELDISTSHSLRSLLGGLIETNSPPRIALDLTALTFCDSTGLGVLVESAVRCESAGGWLRLDHPRPSVARLLTVTGLTGLTSGVVA
ncbi:MAG TPA: STAS domain-containing protein [Phytomonospora sp.]